MSQMSQTCLLITLIKCLKGHKSLGSLGSVVKGQKCLGLLFNVKNQKWLTESVSQSVTRSPIELFWTAKNSELIFCQVEVDNAAA